MVFKLTYFNTLYGVYAHKPENIQNIAIWLILTLNRQKLQISGNYNKTPTRRKKYL